MSRHYSEVDGPDDEYALPDVETFYMDAADFREADEDTWMRDYQTEQGGGPEDFAGWYWWTCLPGCLPDSEPCGPFKTEAEALADAQDNAE